MLRSLRAAGKLRSSFGAPSIPRGLLDPRTMRMRKTGRAGSAYSTGATAFRRSCPGTSLVFAFSRQKVGTEPGTEGSANPDFRRESKFRAPPEFASCDVGAGQDSAMAAKSQGRVDESPRLTLWCSVRPLRTRRHRQFRAPLGRSAACKSRLRPRVKRQRRLLAAPGIRLPGSCRATKFSRETKFSIYLKCSA